MIHELDIAVRRYAEERMPRQPGAAATGIAATAAARVGAARLSGARVSPWGGERPIPPAALRVLETTWRVWREPAA
jgi:hypothetical protein